MSKATYIIILLIISVECWTLLPISYILTPNTAIFFYLLWLLVGILVFKKNRFKSFWKQKSKPVWWIFLAVFISFFTAWIFHGQGILQSIITSRHMLSYLALPALFVINPHYRDLKKAITAFAVMSLTVMVLDSYSPVIITTTHARWGIDEPLKAHLPYLAPEDFLHLLPGTYTIMIASFFYMGDVIKGKFSSLLPASFFMIGLFLVQNRSMLLAAFGVFLFAIFFTKGAKTSLKIAIILIIIILVVLSYSVWMELFDETKKQVDNVNYDRWTSYYYFLFKASPNIICEIFGNGFLSDVYNKNSWNLAVQGIYNVDVGFIGMWNQYGIIPIIVFMGYIIKAIFKKKSFEVKAIAISILICSPTRAYFVFPAWVMWAVIFFYMYYNSSSITRVYQHITKTKGT